MTADEKRIQKRLKNAWAALPTDDKQNYRPLMDAAHAYIYAPTSLGLAESNQAAPHEMVMVKSFLDDDMESLDERMMLVKKPDFGPKHLIIKFHFSR